MPPSTSPLQAAADGVRIAVRVSPKASRAGVAGLKRDADGRAWVNVRISAPAQGGKANAALLKLLAKEWGLAPSQLRIASGAQDRRKTIAAPSRLSDKIRIWIEELKHD